MTWEAPNGFATGGVSGIAIILAKLPLSLTLGITQSIYMLIINVILLILGVIILGKKCGILTIYCSLMLSLENFVFELALPIEKISGSLTLTSQPILELVYAVLLTGIGSALLFRYKASSGGTDIVENGISDFQIAVACNGFGSVAGILQDRHIRRRGLCGSRSLFH